MSTGLWVMIIGAMITFPFAYAFGRKAVKFMDDEEPEEKFMYEFMCIIVGLMGAMVWPITWIAYVVKMFTEKGNSER